MLFRSLYARYEIDPNSVDAEWQAFFAGMKDSANGQQNAQGPSWKKTSWPEVSRGEMIGALTGDWREVEKSVGDKLKSKAQARGVELSAADVQQATRDSVRAIMLIRAYRMRGHFHAKLDPLGIETEKNEHELDPRSYGFTEADWDAVMDVNLKSAFFLSQAVARSMIAAGARGKIINIASMLSFQGGIRVASYTASKSGIAGITKLLANEWASRGINVNAIAPGYFATNNTEALRADPVRNRDILARIPAGRWGAPEDLGGAAVFLASAASDYVHGTILPVDGGWLAR